MVHLSITEVPPEYLLGKWKKIPLSWSCDL